jgi:transposase
VARTRQVLVERFGVALSEDTVWRRLREAGLTYQKPERRYF